MKLRNKLIPLLSLVSLSTVVAPVATSCTQEATFEKIEINTEKAKTEYFYHEYLNTDNLVINAVYSDGTKKAIPAADVEFTPALTKKLTCDDEKVTVKYQNKTATYDINVYEDIENYQFRGKTYLEEIGEETATLRPNEAGSIYWSHKDLDVNVKDDVFYNLQRWCSLANEALKLEEDPTHELTPLEQAIIKYVLYEMLGAFNLEFVGSFKSTRGVIKNLEATWDSSKNIAYVSADITLRLEAKMVDRTTSPTEPPVEIGTYTLETNHKLNKLPYRMAYWGVEIAGIEIVEPCFGTVLVENDLTTDTNWTVERTYTGVAVSNTGRTEYSVNKIVYDSSYILSEQSRNLLQFHCNYFDGVTIPKTK